MTSTATPAGERTLVRLVLLVLAVVVLAPLLVMSLAMPMMGMMGWWWHDGGTFGVAPWWGLVMAFGWLAVLLIVGYVVYRGLVGGTRPAESTDPALEALRLAHARGDLTNEEFEERRAVLAADGDAEA